MVAAKHRHTGASVLQEDSPPRAFPRKGGNMTELEVLNPVAEIRGDLKPQGVSPRPATLEGRTVGLLWAGTTNGDVALRRVEERLQERFPKMRTKFYPGEHPFAEGLLREVAEACDAVVIATAD
ncbi:MAG: hypothetical protein HYY45_15335 [Deltaproteobacteria bacterium]|nr:hypothetical protein [Deltaproteobacteria bacterium]